MNTARVEIPRTFGVDACFDGSVLVLHNSGALPLSATLSGDTGKVTRQENNYGIAAVTTRLYARKYARDPTMLLPGDKLRVRIGPGSSTVGLKMSAAASFYAVAWVVADFVAPARYEAVAALVKELDDGFRKHLRCTGGHPSRLRRLKCAAILKRDVAFALGRAGVKFVKANLKVQRRRALGAITSGASLARWIDAQVKEAKALRGSGHIRVGPLASDGSGGGGSGGGSGGGHDGDASGGDNGDGDEGGSSVVPPPSSPFGNRINSMLSAGPAGEAGNGYASPGGASSDGRWVVFASNATNLTLDDTHGHTQVFERDTATGVTRLVSVSSTGSGGGNCDSTVFGFNQTSVSTDGRHVIFSSCATDLSALDTHGFSQVYERDMVSGATRMVSVNAAGTSGGNRHSAWVSHYAYRRTGAISADGRVVVFQSSATDLTASAPSSGPALFARDLVQGKTTVVSGDGQPCFYSFGGPDYAAGPVALSRDGRYIAFGVCKPRDSRATHTTHQLYVRDMATGGVTPLSTGANGDPADVGWFNLSEVHGPLAISGDGETVIFVAQGAYTLTGSSLPGADRMMIFSRTVRTGATTLLVDAQSYNEDKDQYCTTGNFAASASLRYLLFLVSCDQMTFLVERDLAANEEEIIDGPIYDNNCSLGASAVSNGGSSVIFTGCDEDGRQQVWRRAPG